MNDKVVEIPPAKFDERYRSYRVLYVYVPDLRQWRWTFEVPTKPTCFSDLANTRHDAIMAAHRQIDRVGKILS